MLHLGFRKQFTRYPRHTHFNHLWPVVTIVCAKLQGIHRCLRWIKYTLWSRFIFEKFTQKNFTTHHHNSKNEKHGRVLSILPLGVPLPCIDHRQGIREETKACSQKNNATWLLAFFMGMSCWNVLSRWHKLCVLWYLHLFQSSRQRNNPTKIWWKRTGTGDEQELRRL